MEQEKTVDRQQASVTPDHQQQSPPGQTHKLVRNAFFNSFSWVASVIVNIVTIPIIVHYLGLEGYGIYALLTGLFGYFSLMDLGMGQGVVKYVAQYAGLNDHDAVSHLVNGSFIVQLGIGLLGVAALWTFNDAIIRLLNVSDVYYADARDGLYISSVGFLVTMLMANFSNALQGLQKYEVVGKANLFLSILTTVATVVLLLWGGGLVGIIWISVAGAVITFVVFVALLKRNFNEYRFSWKVPISHLKLLAAFGNFMLVSRIAHALNTYFIRYIVSAFVGPAAVTFIVVPTKLLSFLQGGIGSIAAVILPFASESIARERQDEFRRLYLKAARTVACISIPMFVFLIVYSRQILTLWMGNGFADEVWVIQAIIGTTFMISSFTILPTNAILGLGLSKHVASFTAGVAVLSLLLCTVLTSAFGTIGAAAGVLATQVMAFPFVWFVTVRTLSIPWKEYINESVSPCGPLSLWFLTLTVLSVLLFTFFGWESAIAPLVCGLFLIAMYFVMVQKQGLVSFVALGSSVGRIWK